MEIVDVAVVGSGPYGLSVSANLSAAGVEHRIFGPPMLTWRSMPRGMYMKSLDFATNVYTPRPGFKLVDYCRARTISSAEPVAMDLFARYGLWAQEQLVPHLEPVEVTRLGRPNGAFEIQLASGETLGARRVVMATGLTYFARLPEALRGLPAGLASHTARNRDYDSFRGRDVAVLGAGQSALEAAVMLHEAGARPQLLVRGPGALFASPPPKSRPLRHHVLHPLSVLGHGRLNFFLQHVPFGVHYLPDKHRVSLTRRHLGPWGAWWLAPRFQGKVPVVPRTTVIRAEPHGSRLNLRLHNSADGIQRDMVVDHGVAGTGYEPDLSAIPFLDPGLLGRIDRLERAPRLSARFESSVPGLYFVGAASAFSFGPLFRFVAGAGYAAEVVTRHLAARGGRKARVVAWPNPARIFAGPPDRRTGAGDDAAAS
jgi:cation diffusion facilitator CzcD-associated flavoprotein CzcO